MVGKKTFKNRLLACLCALVVCFMVMPVSVKASQDVTPGFMRYFSTGEVFITDSKVTYSDTWFYDLGQEYSGSYIMWFTFDYNTTFTQTRGSALPSFVTDFVLVIDGKEYLPLYDVGNGHVIFGVTFSSLRCSHVSLRCDLSFWTNPITSAECAGEFSVSVTLTDFSIRDISDQIPSQYVIDEAGNMLLQKGNELQEDANELQDRENKLQEEANTMQSQEIELQEEANELQEEANETSKSLLDKITDFFDNFFSRLGEFLLGLIVPSAEELTAFLDEVNDWFGERLGFIWYPFSFAVDMVSALANGEADTGFPVPEFKLNILGTEYQIWGGMTVDLDAFDIFKYVRIFTSFLLVGGIVKLAYDKWDEWIGGHGVG